jgi:hypothetical protein
MFGRCWVASLVVLLPVVTLCIVILAAMAVATVAALAVLARLAPHQFHRASLDGLGLG